MTVELQLDMNHFLVAFTRTIAFAPRVPCDWGMCQACLLGYPAMKVSLVSLAFRTRPPVNWLWEKGSGRAKPHAPGI